jgi:hypothetical protein
MEMDLDLEYISTVTISHVQKTAYHWLFFFIC